MNASRHLGKYHDGSAEFAQQGQVILHGGDLSSTLRLSSSPEYQPETGWAVHVPEWAPIRWPGEIYYPVQSLQSLPAYLLQGQVSQGVSAPSEGKSS